MKINIVLFCCLFLVYSCLPKKEPRVIIVNNTKITLDSVKVFANSNNPTTFFSLKENEKVKGRIVFDRNKKGDGSYSILVYKKDSIFVSKGFGYYTNGASLNYRFDIKIEPDTLIIKSK